MPYGRNNSVVGETHILDAARDRIIDVGLRRTTLTDIARLAGVSRMTIYRRWPEMARLVGDLMTREWAALFNSAAQAATGTNVRARMASSLAAGSRAMRNNPVFRRIVELDPEILLPYLINRLGTSQEMLISLLVEQITEGQQEGSIRQGDPTVLASSLMLTLQSFTLSASTVPVEPDILDQEIATVIDRYLAP